MIQRPKILLFKTRILSAILVLILLAGFFIYAIEHDPSFFQIIAVSNLILLFFLFILRYRYMSSQAQTRLQQERYSENINLLSAELDKEKVLISSLENKTTNYLQLKNISERLSQCVFCKDVIEVLVDETTKIFSEKSATTILYLVDIPLGELSMVAARQRDLRISIKSKKGDLFDQWVAKSLKPLLATDTHKDFRFDLENVQKNEIYRSLRSLMVVPLTIGMKTLGLLRLDSPKEGQFSTDDLRLFCALADLGAVAIESAQLYEHIQNLAMKDGLTGLYLRRFLLDRMVEELARQLRRKKELSFLMIDIDYFKKYNDTFGHIAGDLALKTLADICLKIFKKPGNIICRYGGEEFVVFMPDCSKQEAKVLAEELRKTVQETEIVLRREKTRMTVSIGIACFPQDAQLKEELIQRADEALYRAKQKGRNRVCSQS